MIVGRASGEEPVPAAAEGGESAESGANGSKVTHVVQRGDTASVIAEKYGVNLADFLQWNGLTKRSVLHPGDEYILYTDGAAPESEIRTASAKETQEGEKVIHVVSRGHNPTTIARRYGVRLTDLFKWNNWTKTPVLHVGDKVVVYKK